MFLSTNDRIINLKNVSNINILSDRNRIVFNLNYNIEINNNNHSKFISDYVYWDAVNETDMVGNISLLKLNNYIAKNFIETACNNGYINKDEISSIKLSEKKHRVIFNLSHPVTFKDFDRNERITSEFVYVNCRNFEDYKKYIKYVKEELGV